MTSTNKQERGKNDSFELRSKGSFGIKTKKLKKKKKIHGSTSCVFKRTNDRGVISSRRFPGESFRTKAAKGVKRGEVGKSSTVPRLEVLAVLTYIYVCMYVCMHVGPVNSRLA